MVLVIGIKMYLKDKGKKKINLLHTYFLRVARALLFGLFFADTTSHTPKGIKQAQT